MDILFVNACVREQSRTLLLAGYLLEKIPGEVTEIKLEEEDMKPLSKDLLAKRDNLLNIEYLQHLSEYGYYTYKRKRSQRHIDRQSYKGRLCR